MRRHVPQLNGTPGIVVLYEEKTLADEQEIDFVQPPDGGVCHLIEWIRLRHEVEERVVGEFRFRTILVDLQQPPLYIRKVACDSVYHRQAWTCREHRKPLRSVPRRWPRPTRNEVIAGVAILISRFVLSKNDVYYFHLPPQNVKPNSGLPFSNSTYAFAEASTMSFSLPTGKFSNCRK